MTSSGCFLVCVACCRRGVGCVGVTSSGCFLVCVACCRRGVGCVSVTSSGCFLVCVACCRRGVVCVSVTSSGCFLVCVACRRRMSGLCLVDAGGVDSEVSEFCRYVDSHSVTVAQSCTPVCRQRNSSAGYSPLSSLFCHSLSAT